MRKITSLVLMVSALMITSCKKEGCIDSKAKNYTDGAKKDDGSCTYSASTSFWFNSDAALNFAGELYTSLDFYVDGVKIGTKAIDQYVENAPDCGTSGGVNFNFELGTTTSRSFTYQVKSKDLLNVEQVLVSKTETVGGGDCKAVQIIY